MLDYQIPLTNKPDISDVHAMEQLAEQAFQTSTNFFDLTSELATKFRASILLIPVGLKKFGEVRLVLGGVKLAKGHLIPLMMHFIKQGLKLRMVSIKLLKL